MEQYISKTTLLAEIEGLKERYALCPTRNNYEEGLKEGRLIGYIDALDKINSIEVKEADLEKELDTWRHNHFNGRRDKNASGEYLERSSQLDIAKYFFELGLKSKSSYVDIPNIDDTLKEMGVDPDSKEANNFKNCYYMALEKLKEKKNDVYEHNNDIYSTKQRGAREV